MMKVQEARAIAENPQMYPEALRRVAFLKLGNCALRAFPSSQRQREFRDAAEKLRPYWKS